MKSLRPLWCCLALIGWAAAPLLTKESKEPWTKQPFESWSQADTAKVLNDSPWVQIQTYSSESPGGNQGVNEANHQFTVRLFSALPIRQAYVRMLELMNNYDTLAPERRQEFDTKVKGLLSVDVSDQVVIALSYKTNDPQAQRDIKRFFDTATTAMLNQNAFLYGPRGRVDLREYVPPGQDGLGARLIFPRRQNGQPILQPGDKELRFEMDIPPIGQHLLVGFRGSKMMYQDSLAY